MRLILLFLCTALRLNARKTRMNIRVIPTKGEKLCSALIKSAKREKIKKRHAVELLFLCNALRLNARKTHMELNEGEKVMVRAKTALKKSIKGEKLKTTLLLIVMKTDIKFPAISSKVDKVMLQTKKI